MLAPFALKLGPFDEGLNTFQDPSMLTERQAVRCIGAELIRGTLRGMWGPGTAIQTLATQNARFLHFHRGLVANGGWLAIAALGSNGYVNWACRDADDGSGNAISYVTQIHDDLTFAVPRIYVGANNYPMGLTPPAAAPALTAGAAGQIEGVYTYVVEVGGVSTLESNPSARTASTAGGGVYTAVASGDARVTHIYYYQTKDADFNGLLYFVGKSTNAAATLNAAGLVADTSRVMNWGIGGNLDDATATFDHSPLPLVTCFANKLHGGEDALDGNQNGTLFYAIGQAVGWCKTGSPQYAPTRNLWKLPAIVQAQVARGNSVYSFTELGTWVHSGVNDTVISTTPVAARHVIRVGCGKTAIDTPYGIAFLAREGLVLMNDEYTRIVTEGILDPNDLLQNFFWFGAYQDHTYYLAADYLDGSFGNTGTAVAYAIDLRSLVADYRGLPTQGAVRVTKLALAMTAGTVLPNPALGGSTPVAGLYVYNGVTGTVKPWRPAERGNVAGSTQFDATWRSGRLQMAQPLAQKEAHWLTIDGTGPVTLKFFADPTDLSDDTKPAYTFTATLPMVRRRAVAQSLRGRSLSVLLSVPAGSEVQNVLVEGNFRGELLAGVPSAV